MSHIFMEHMDILLEVDGGTEYLVDMLFSGLEAEIDGVEPPPLSLEEEQKADKIVEEFFDKAREKHHRALDVKYFELLQAAVPANRRSDIVLVQSSRPRKRSESVYLKQQQISGMRNKRLIGSSTTTHSSHQIVQLRIGLQRWQLPILIHI